MVLQGWDWVDFSGSDSFFRICFSGYDRSFGYWIGFLGLDTMIFLRIGLSVFFFLKDGLDELIFQDLDNLIFLLFRLFKELLTYISTGKEEFHNRKRVFILKNS